QKYSLKLKKDLSILSKKNIKLKHFSHQSFPTFCARSFLFKPVIPNDNDLSKIVSPSLTL
ncbi:TPA: hypothetical protein ACQMZJ_001267, partial [Streptococcus pyogenes]